MVLTVSMDRPRRTALVTGATRGIGLATAAELVDRGVRVLVHGRTRAGAEATAAQLGARRLGASVRAVWGDLSVRAEVRALADLVMQEPRLDVLIHNAGLEQWERVVTSDGFELTLAVNHVAPFLLTRLLTPLLERSRPSRVVFVSSVVHGWGSLHWDDLDAAGWYSPEPVYYQSKLAAALTAQEFARRLAPKGVTVLLVPPGLTRTGFARNFRGMARWWSKLIGPVFFRRPEQVAVELASVSLDERFAAASGAYVDRLEPGLPSAKARVREDQQRLWAWTSARLGLVPEEPAPAGPLPPLELPRPRLGPWVRAVALGELLGFSATALVAFVGLAVGGRPVTVPNRVVALLVMALAGTLEGASLGFFQWRALRRWLPELAGRRFIGATVAVAAGGWVLGMSVPLVMALRGAMPASGGADGPGALGVTAFALGFGALAGAAFGAAQGAVLTKHTCGVGWWVAGSSLGWACALPFAYVAGSLGTTTMTWWQALGLSGAAGLAMGLCVGLATFAATRRMAARDTGPR